MNAQRAAAGVAAVQVDSRVEFAASGHANEQAARNTLSHRGANGSNLGTRLSFAGYGWSTWGEDVGAGQPDCASVVGAWMASATHRQVILNPAFVNVGIGVAQSSNGTNYWTLDFAAP